ncbi:MAG: UvrD-helicase domain-containing protein [Desulfovibrio sp.]|nr:UvrD-helicase domain-containing protein [Desulfovibrio sp.]
MNSELCQLKASAGSGKTFTLTKRFLDLLGAADPEESGIVCRKTPREGHSWPEILAVTFTNKAAAEMKERVVGSLKRTALGIRDGQRADWNPDHARDMLERILRRYQRLNIRTIDSLLNLLLRIFALEANIPPDFELVFDDEEIFASVLERFQAACLEDDSPERELLEKALSTLLHQEQSEGFWVADKIRTRLQEIMRHLRGSDSPLCTDQEELRELLRPAHASLVHAATALEKRLASKELQGSKNFINFLCKCRDVGFPTEAPHTSAYASKQSLIECLLKKSQGRVAEEDDVLYFRLRETLQRYGREQAILSGAIYLAPCVQLAERLARELSRIEQERGQVLGLGLPHMVRRRLEDGGGAPDAFCRLGGRLHHLLVDEFQDTSRDQWAAVTPLAQECLAKGGSLFYVGDVKQAIYGWRGGDASLFDEIRSQPDLAPIALRNTSDQLPHNWRSLDRVVAFNNHFFTRLADSDLNADLAQRCLGRKASPDDVAVLARALSSEFQDAHQTLPPAEGAAPRKGGYVQVQRLPGSDDRHEVEQQALEALTSRLLHGVRPRRAWRDMAVLVRSHDHAALVCDRLVSEGVPVITENSLQLDRHPVVRELVALLRFLEHPDEDMALAELLLGGTLLPETAYPPAGPDQSQGLQMHEWLAGLQGADARKPLWRVLQRDQPRLWQDWLAPFSRKTGLLTPYDLVAEMLAFFCVLERHPGAELHVRRFQEVVHRASERGMGSLSAFLDFWQEKSGEEKVPLPENVDAVRIMTIHKSKGLEFPVVFAPFLYWPWPASQGLTEVDIQGRRVLTRMVSALGPEYQAKVRSGVLEDLHLLYVTWTRAREELYAWFPEKRPRQKSPATDAIELVLELPEGQDTFEYGTMPSVPEEDPRQMQTNPPSGTPSLAVEDTLVQPAQPPCDEEETEPETDSAPPAWQARLRVYRHMERDVADLSARLRGDVAHKAMELLRPPRPGKDATPEELRQAACHAAQSALHQFPVLATMAEEERKGLEQDVTAMLSWALSRPELRPALLHGAHEPDMVTGDETSETSLKRPDLVYFTPDTTLVLEFKTGGHDPAHAPQLAAYLNLLTAWDAHTPARGLLVYLDRQEVQAVLPTSPQEAR